MARRVKKSKANPTPSPTGLDGQRDAHGRFRPGNKAGLGNPLGVQVQRLRAELISTASPADMRSVAKMLIRKARSGDLAAVKLWLSYTIGNPIEADILGRIEALESTAEVLQHGVEWTAPGR